MYDDDDDDNGDNDDDDEEDDFAVISCRFPALQCKHVRIDYKTVKTVDCIEP